MNDTLHDPAYRAAVAQANADLREIGEILTQLLGRQQQLSLALDALNQLSTDAVAEPSRTAKPVYEMSARSSRQASTVDSTIQDAVKVQALA